MISRKIFQKVNKILKFFCKVLILQNTWKNFEKKLLSVLIKKNSNNKLLVGCPYHFPSSIFSTFKLLFSLSKVDKKVTPPSFSFLICLISRAPSLQPPNLMNFKKGDRIFLFVLARKKRKVRQKKAAGGDKWLLHTRFSPKLLINYGRKLSLSHLHARISNRLKFSSKEN